LTAEAATMLVDYPWHGNVRELKNLAEYLAYLDKRSIEPKDILPMLKWPSQDREPAADSLFSEALGPDREHYEFLLDCLQTSYRNKQRSGRRSLLECARTKDLFLTEAQIRRALTRMGDYGLVQLSNGRGGTTITPAGIEALKRLRVE
jgi:sigma-54 dependent transcriptional regulator, acetoin dehydrogenase operon transcriptional activator AcoR